MLDLRGRPFLLKYLDLQAGWLHQAKICLDKYYSHLGFSFLNQIRVSHRRPGAFVTEDNDVCVGFRAYVDFVLMK